VETKNIFKKRILSLLLTVLMLLSCVSMLGVSAGGASEVDLLKIAISHIHDDVEENNILPSKREKLRDISLKLLELETGSYSSSEIMLLQIAISHYKEDLDEGIENGTWITADYTEIDAEIAELESVAKNDDVIAKIPEVKSEVEVLKANPESSKADVDVLMTQVTGLKNCNEGTHVSVDCICTYCGRYKAIFLAERVIDYNGDVCTESKYFDNLADALTYAEKSTEDGTYYSESAVVKLVDNYNIAVGESALVAENVVLDLNSFDLVNNGTLTFASVYSFESNGGTYTGEGTVTIGENEGVIYDNTLYYFGGEYATELTYPLDLVQFTVPTYFTAGEGFALYSADENPVLTLNNATIYSNKEGHGDTYTNVIRYSGEDTLTILFSGENNLYATEAMVVYGIRADGPLVLEAVGENAVLNVECSDAVNYNHAINSNGLTVNSGTLNLKLGVGINDVSYGIVSVGNITVAENAVVNVSTGEAENNSVGVVLTNGILTVDGVLNTSFDTAGFVMAGVMAIENAINEGAGTINAVVIDMNTSSETPNVAYSTRGDAVVKSSFAPYVANGLSASFTVPEGTNLIVSEGAVADLSALSAEDITFEGKLTIDGTLILPASFNIRNADVDFAGKGTIKIGEEELSVTKLYDNVAGYSISLGGNIAVNYYMNLTDETLNDGNSKVVFTVPNGDSAYTVEIPVYDASSKDGYYVFTCEVAAKEMTSAIHAKIVTSDGETLLEDYTVQQYAKVILLDTDKYAKEQELVKAMLNYGTQAQIYFNHNSKNPANSIMAEADRDFGTYSFDEFAPVISGAQTGVTYYGSTLSLNSETAVKYYFVVEDENNMPEFKINGALVATTKNGNLFEIEISDIPAHKLDEVYTVEAGALKIEYGAFSYAYQASKTNKEALKNTVNALYAYNLAAAEYNKLGSIL